MSSIVIGLGAQGLEKNYGVYEIFPSFPYYLELFNALKGIEFSL